MDLASEEGAWPNRNIWDNGTGMMHSTCYKNEEGKRCGTAAKETRLRKEDQQPESKLTEKRRGVERQVSPGWQRSWDSP